MKGHHIYKLLIELIVKCGGTCLSQLTFSVAIGDSHIQAVWTENSGQKGIDDLFFRFFKLAAKGLR